jgi:mono/diheme cytochrome c family protein
MRNLIAIVFVSSMLFGAGPARSDDAVTRGDAVIEQWCRDCHLRADDPPDPVMAPPYEEIVLREGRDRAYFRRFLHEDHFPMPTFRLYEHEKDDVVAWLMALQKQQFRNNK